MSKRISIRDINRTAATANPIAIKEQFIIKSSPHTIFKIVEDSKFGMFERLWYLLCKSCQNRGKILSKRISVSDVNPSNE